MASDIIELKNDNIIRSIDMDGEIYFLNRKGISDLHRYMQDIVIKMLLNKGYSVSEARPGEDKPDIMTETFNIEIETGFKHDKRDLIRRIKNSNKKTYVIVPNNDVKSRYNDMHVFTIKEFKDLLNKIKN
ncbi:hypothetical protein [Picrophilus oshimae]|uniref:hypothetical protein n=1 Tax=Picrophilus oshimae TaxID=46632 RepID=UPI000A03CFFB|nr:hypothetical protein [Picrophilus oshimae]